MWTLTSFQPLSLRNMRYGPDQSRENNPPHNLCSLRKTVFQSCLGLNMKCLIKLKPRNSDFILGIYKKNHYNLILKSYFII